MLGGLGLVCNRVNMGPFCVSASPYFDEGGNVAWMVEVYRDMRSLGSDKRDTDCPILWTAKHRKNVIDCREHIQAAEGPLPIDKSIFLQEAQGDSPPEIIGVVRNASEIVDLRRASDFVSRAEAAVRS